MKLQADIKIGDQILTVEIHEKNRLLGGKVSQLERLACPSCSSPDCNFECDGSQVDDMETTEEVTKRLKFNGMLDALESIVLAHACAQVGITDPEYTSGLNDAFNKMQQTID